MVATLPQAAAPPVVPAYDLCVPLAAFGPDAAETWTRAEAKVLAELVMMGWHPARVHFVRHHAAPPLVWAQVRPGSRLAVDLSAEELARAGLGPDLMPLPGDANGAAFAQARGDAWRWPADGVPVEGADYRTILEIQRGVAVADASILALKRAGLAPPAAAAAGAA